MSSWYRTPYGLEIKKDPDAKRDYSLSWVDMLKSGVTISTVSHTVPAGLTKVSESVNSQAVTDKYGRVHPIGTITTVTLSGGTDSTRYQVVARATFSTTEIDDRTFFVNVESQ